MKVDSLPDEPQGKTQNTGMGSLSLLQFIFLTQELNRGLLQADSLPTELIGKSFKIHDQEQNKIQQTKDTYMLGQYQITENNIN